MKFLYFCQLYYGAGWLQGPSVCVCVCVCDCMLCVCLSVCECMCVYVCACVCVWERERVRDTEGSLASSKSVIASDPSSESEAGTKDQWMGKCGLISCGDSVLHAGNYWHDARAQEICNIKNPWYSIMFWPFLHSGPDHHILSGLSLISDISKGFPCKMWRLWVIIVLQTCLQEFHHSFQSEAKWVCFDL